MYVMISRVTVIIKDISSRACTCVCVIFLTVGIFLSGMCMFN